MQQCDKYDRPIPNSYWVRPRCFAAGEYPGVFSRGEVPDKLHGLIGAGIDHFIDLTGEEDWLEPYDNLAQEEGRRLGKTMRRESYPMSGVDVPRRHGDMNAILDAIDAALDARSSVYVHCWAGVGRTGTVVGCWLVRHGFTGDEALEQIAEWWKGVEKADRIPNSPETHVQREYVRRWTETSQERCHG